MEDDQAGDQFCEEDIDQILQRRTQVCLLINHSLSDPNIALFTRSRVLFFLVLWVAMYFSV